MILDCTGWLWDMPNVQRVHCTNRVWYGGQDNTQLPDEGYVRETVRMAVEQNAWLVLDIEHLGDVKYLPLLKQISKWVMDEAPTLRFGYYGVIPPHWAPPSAGYADLTIPEVRQGYHDYITQWLTLRYYMKAVFPSRYAWKVWDRWDRDTQWFVAECKRFKLPVAPFLRARNDGENVPPETEIDPWRFAAQVRTALDLTDRAVIWDDPRQPDWPADKPEPQWVKQVRQIAQWP